MLFVGVIPNIVETSAARYLLGCPKAKSSGQQYHIILHHDITSSISGIKANQRKRVDYSTTSLEVFFRSSQRTQDEILSYLFDRSRFN
jgi:hypothetical protein